MSQKTKIYKDALKEILKTSRLDICKEIAAEALEEDVMEFIEQNDLRDLNFNDDFEERDLTKEISKYGNW